jgi:hypothetical protein
MATAKAKQAIFDSGAWRACHKVFGINLRLDKVLTLKAYKEETHVLIWRLDLPIMPLLTAAKTYVAG